VSVIGQRVEFCRMVEAGGVPFAELCRRFGVKRDTGYKWWSRYQVEGEVGLADRSRRPKTSPGRIDPGVEDVVCRVREEHPAWGGRKIRGFLLRQGWQVVPAASTISQILRRQGLTVEPSHPRQFCSFERAEPNDLWQMDFKGWFPLTGGQPVHTLGVLDDHSRFNLCLAACSDQRTQTVKELLVATFRHYGLPWAILTDNGSPWGNNRGTPWTPLTVWLADLGVDPLHSRPRHPQTAGKEERFHRTLDLEVIATRNRWDSLPQVQEAFDGWRPIYNHHRPHQSLGETVVPADRYRPSLRPYPQQVEPPDYPAGSVIRRVASSGRFAWRGHRWDAGKPFAGHTVDIRPTTTDSIYTVYYRHHPIRTINLSTMSPNTCPPTPRS
jgi:transposase InsO family protein